MASQNPADPSVSFRTRLIQALEARIEPILASGRPTGQFGTEPWIVRDQDVILTLGMCFKSESSRFRGEARLLKAVAAGGRYLRERQDETGMYLFNKKDHSEWGMIYMPWTYLRWMITYDLLGEDLPAEDRAIWEEGLILGYSGISATELSSASNIYPGPLPFEKPAGEGEVIPWIHNIPAHHASGLYLAGRRFGRPEWMEQAVEYMRGVVSYQSEYGWWTEHVGPVVLYNRVYLEALALFYHFSRDAVVQGALVRGNRFHFNYTYPDGSSIETVDERNPYYPVEAAKDDPGKGPWLPRLMPAHPGLYFSEEGRALMGLILERAKARGTSEIENAEYLLLCLPDGMDEPALPATPPSRFRMGEDALLVREDPWLLSFSGYCAVRTPNRFIQDRQNLLSVYHRDTGLILGGGNTKIQPRWSTMTVGDLNLVSPEDSTRETDLAPDTALSYVPEQVSIEENGSGACRMVITTGGAVASIRTEVLSDASLRIGVTLDQAAPDGRAVAVHLTFIRYPGCRIQFSDDSSAELEGNTFLRTGLETIRYQDWKLALPLTAEVRWPVLPHNPYTGNGQAQINEGRLVVSLPLERQGEESQLVLSVGTQ